MGSPDVPGADPEEGAGAAFSPSAVRIPRGDAVPVKWKEFVYTCGKKKKILSYFSPETNK